MRSGASSVTWCIRSRGRDERLPKAVRPRAARAVVKTAQQPARATSAMRERPNLLQGVAAPARAAILHFASKSVDLAHRLAPDKWGMTPYYGGLRLNVGFCEAMTALPDEVRVLCSRRELPAMIHALVQPGYLSAPGSAIVAIATAPFAALKETLLAVRPAHEKMLVLIAGRGFNRGSKAGHKNHVVEALSSAIGRSLPVPGYSMSRESRTAQVDRETAEALEGLAQEALGLRRGRSKALRNAALRRANGRCSVCRSNFARVLGGLGVRVLQVHHLRQLAVGTTPRLTRVEDLVVVCANCHCLIHADPRQAAPPDELRARLRARRRTGG